MEACAASLLTSTRDRAKVHPNFQHKRVGLLPLFCVVCRINSITTKPEKSGLDIVGRFMEAKRSIYPRCKADKLQRSDSAFQPSSRSELATRIDSSLHSE